MKFPALLLKKCRFLAGPTACGKSDVALVLAERIDAEIVALDSMSLYCGMDIGTAKASQEMQSRIPHHLIDVIEPHEEYSVADYVAAAMACCEEIAARGRTPLFVGGTGLYVRAVLRGVFEGPAADWELRRRLESEAAEEPERLHAQLKGVDPVSAARLHPNDLRRIVRALEVFHVSGRPLSAQQVEQPVPADRRPRFVQWLSPPRSWLYRRIDARVLAMFEEGLLEEVERLLSAEQPLSRTARQALGYKETIEHLEGRISLDEAVETIQRRTRQFAKRQHTWFRNLEECEAVEMTGEESAAELVSRLTN